MPLNKFAMRFMAPGLLEEEGCAPIGVGRLSLSRTDLLSAAPSRDFDSGFVLADRSLFSFGSLADVPPGTRARLKTNSVATSERTQNLVFTFIRTFQRNQTDNDPCADLGRPKICEVLKANKRAEKPKPSYL